ncbi:MAG: hypothetical protein HYV32_05010 [Candidatus Kerfeldbacteria bacterium]|nr:hypothetical protein [Candidatus Kerfeldbacteria bacterium]
MNIPALHSTLAADRWYTFTVAEQLGNIGSEVERTISWHKRGKTQQWQNAFDRALELIDLSIGDPRWRNTGTLKEICRTREILCDLFYGENIHHISFEELQKYFLEFGILARRDR